MQILIPMGGAGSRFSSAGYDTPKPFIKFHNKTMIENVVENLGYSNDYIMVMQRTHYKEHSNVFTRISEKTAGFDAVLLDGLTQGAAETCLAAEDKLDPESMLLIANCDQMIDWNPIDFKNWFITSDLDGVIMTFDSQSEKNSYAVLNEDGYVSKTVEKQVISPYATTGLYFWRKAGDFISAAKKMIDNNQRTNNEFYVCPVYNFNIEMGQKIGIYHTRKHWPIGTPEDLDLYLKNNQE